MDRLFKLQFLGPLALFVATLSAELAAQALSYAPSSEFLWFVNLKMFGIFQRSYYLLSDLVSIEGFQLFGIALPIFVLACYGLAARRRLALALASNLSFGYAALLLFSWQTPGPPTAQASLHAIAVPTGAGFYVLAGILGTSLLSFAISHLLYLRASRSET
ncbi:hypothetical protein [Bradyrhizobium sp. RDM4]|uniref:hypothetical protein n=1 Tax=Bradyrhizobium sp. RDM4 TaxID=3378765 RepID=UPI0038FD23DA